MSIHDSNTFEVPNSFYRFRVKNNPAFGSVFYQPRISFTRVNDKVFKIFVEMREHNFSNNTVTVKDLYSFNQPIPDLQEYIKKAQNSNFTDVFTNPALALELMLKSVQKIIGTKKQNKATNSAISSCGSSAPYVGVFSKSSTSVTFQIYNTPLAIFFISNPNANYPPASEVTVNKPASGNTKFTTSETSYSYQYDWTTQTLSYI
jgi:hypothetical protein